jgi:hypothetical protein
MDSSKAKRRAPHLAQSRDGCTRRRKNKKRIFAEFPQVGAIFFNRLARLGNDRRTVVAE